MIQSYPSPSPLPRHTHTHTHTHTHIHASIPLNLCLHQNAEHLPAMELGPLFWHQTLYRPCIVRQGLVMVHRNKARLAVHKSLLQTASVRTSHLQDVRLLLWMSDSRTEVLNGSCMWPQGVGMLGRTVWEQCL